MQGNQADFYSLPQVTQMASNSPQRPREVSSYISPTHPSQVVDYQSLPAHQMAAFNIPQQAPQMRAYPSAQRASQFALQGYQVQPQVYCPQVQQPQQPGRYYTPISTQQPFGSAPKYDHQNQAQVVAQQYRMQQDQIQPSGIQYQPSLQDNLRNSAAMVAQANAANPKPQFRLEDFLSQHH
jgi:hypothetical protein